MSESKSSNHRLECPKCKTTFLNKDYSKHLNKEHESEIFTNKENKKELESLANKKDGRFFRPLELKVYEKTLYYVPCCKKYYSKIETAKPHSKNKECTDIVVQEAKNLLEKVSLFNIVINTPINIDISGNNNSHNTIAPNIVNNITINIDEAQLQKLLKNMVLELDVANKERAELYKKNKKMKTQVKEQFDCDIDSDVSSVLGYFTDEELSDNDDPDRKVKYYDINKNNKTIMKKLNKDYSRKALNLSTKEQKEAQQEEQKKKQEEQEAFDKETKEFERLNRVGILKSEITSLKEQIKKREQLHKERLELMKEENSGITQEVFDSEWSQTSKINSLKKCLMDAQSELSKLNI
jgi:uncharacterized C2H2 Zn-finger protein